MTTVTLEFEDDLLARARELAAAQNVTMVEMIQRLLRVAMQPPLRADELPPLTRRSLGLLPPMTDEQVENALDEARARRCRA